MNSTAGPGAAVDVGQLVAVEHDLLGSHARHAWFILDVAVGPGAPTVALPAPGPNGAGGCRLSHNPARTGRPPPAGSPVGCPRRCRGQPDELRVRPGQRRRGERVLARRERGLPPSAGGRLSHTCSAIKWLASSAARPIVSSMVLGADVPAARRYSPRSPASSGQPAPDRLARAGRHRLPLGAVGPLAVPVEAGPVPERPVGRGVPQLAGRSTGSELTASSGSSADFTPRRTRSRKLGSTTSPLVDQRAAVGDLDLRPGVRRRRSR